MAKQVLVTGASGGLGAALARHYAGPEVTLRLWGRDRVRLEAVAADCERAGAAVQVRALDLLDSVAAVAAIVEEDMRAPINIALLVAGIGDIAEPDERGEDPARLITMAAVNFVTPSAMAAALAERMAVRGRGGIVLIGSAAAFHALPFAAAYAASKAGLARFTEALRIAMAPHGVRILLVSPGPIDTPAGRKVPAPAALLMQPDAVAARIVRAAARGTGHLIVPWPFRLLRLIDPLLPGAVRDRLLRAARPAQPSRPG